MTTLRPNWPSGLPSPEALQAATDAMRRQYTMPLTWGLFRPVIVLPSGAEHWPEDRRRIVLSHELAHIARHDWLLQICAELVRALYWFHPLAWLAAARLRQESERACDDDGLAHWNRALPLRYSTTRSRKDPGKLWPCLVRCSGHRASIQS